MSEQTNSSEQELEPTNPKYKGRTVAICGVTIFLSVILLVAPVVIWYRYSKDVTYQFDGTDHVYLDNPISTLWCEGQDLKMNARFKAALIHENQKIPTDRKKGTVDVELSYSDEPGSRLFFLLEGSKVEFSACIKLNDSRLMVVKGGKTLERCDALYDDPIPTNLGSFANDIQNCYAQSAVFDKSVPSSNRCFPQDIDDQPKITLDAKSSGYYHFIFYTTYDLVEVALMRYSLEKVEYNFSVIANSCVSKTSCSFDFKFLSSEKVFVEISPQPSGIEGVKEPSNKQLVTSCRPRLIIYITFPFVILLFNLVMYFCLLRKKS